eukprot:1194884-Prorocentrum_minimum.AAC.11
MMRDDPSRSSQLNRISRGSNTCAFLALLWNSTTSLAGALASSASPCRSTCRRFGFTFRLATIYCYSSKQCITVAISFQTSSGSYTTIASILPLVTLPAPAASSSRCTRRTGSPLAPRCGTATSGAEGRTGPPPRAASPTPARSWPPSRSALLPTHQRRTAPPVAGRLQPRPPALQPSRRKLLCWEFRLEEDSDALERPIDRWISIDRWTSPTAHPGDDVAWVLEGGGHCRARHLAGVPRAKVLGGAVACDGRAVCKHIARGVTSYDSLHAWRSRHRGLERRRSHIEVHSVLLEHDVHQGDHLNH